MGWGAHIGRELMGGFMGATVGGRGSLWLLEATSLRPQRRAGVGIVRQRESEGADVAKG